MAPVIINAELVAQLTANGGKVPLVDHDGNVVGCFLSLDRLARLEKDFDERMDREPTLEEFRRSLANPKRHTTEDLLKLLEE